MDVDEEAWVLGETDDPPILTPPETAPSVKKVCITCGGAIQRTSCGAWEHRDDVDHLYRSHFPSPTPL